MADRGDIPRAPKGSHVWVRVARLAADRQEARGRPGTAAKTREWAAKREQEIAREEAADQLRADPTSGPLHEHRARLVQPWHAVRVHWPDGTHHDDEIRGDDRDSAIDNAEWNWAGGNPYGRADHIEYLGPGGPSAGSTDNSIARARAAMTELDADEPPPDWWADAPPSDRCDEQGWTQ